MKVGPPKSLSQSDGFRCTVFRFNGNTRNAQYLQSTKYTYIHTHLIKHTHTHPIIHTHISHQTQIHIPSYTNTLPNTHRYHHHIYTPIHIYTHCQTHTQTHPIKYTHPIKHTHTPQPNTHAYIHTTTTTTKPTYWYTYTHRQTSFFFSKIRSPGTRVYISYGIPSPDFHSDYSASAVSCFINRVTSESENSLFLLPFIAPFVSFKKMCLVPGLQLYSRNRILEFRAHIYSPISSLCQKRNHLDLTSKTNCFHFQQQQLSSFKW